MIAISPQGFPHNIDQNANADVIFSSINDQNYGETWRRSGFCNRCGDCCDDSENIFSELDGNGDANPLTPVVPGKCAYFRWGEDGLAQCTGRTTQYYLQGCAWQPSKAEHLTDWPNCTYTFEKLNDGQN